MNTAVSTANRIWMRYCRKAVRAPTCMAPSLTRAAPNQMTATVERLRIAVMTGTVTANRRLTDRVVSNRSRLAASKRCSSCFVRTKARMTRMPDSVSRMTWLIRSIFTCMTRKSGIARHMTAPMTMAMSGSTTSSRPDKGTSVRNAMMIPPTIRIGAETMIVRPKKRTVWTCWTSFVFRVMSDAGPNWLTSTCENVSTLVKIARADVAPEAHRDLRAQIHGRHRRDAQQAADDEHQGAHAQDVVGVAARDAVVDDVGVQIGQVQAPERTDQQQHQDRDQRHDVRAQVGPEQGDHRVLAEGRTQLGPDAAQRTQAHEEAGDLVVGHPREDRGQSRAALPGEGVEHPAAAFGRVNHHDPPVVRIAAPHDELAVLHPVDDARRTGDRDVEAFRQPAHRQRSRLEDREDVEMDEAERPAQPGTEHSLAFARRPDGEFVEQPFRRDAAIRYGCVIQCHIDNLHQM